ncbi:peptidyl-tRNA hydrolase PTH2-domain-containing protein [Obelidium mucronatum]|nr:peptidyl-tRNA hydrolase PTH2-domain-containing protein [Obelidium mucronatum]
MLTREQVVEFLTTVFYLTLGVAESVKSDAESKKKESESKEETKEAGSKDAATKEGSDEDEDDDDEESGDDDSADDSESDDNGQLVQGDWKMVLLVRTDLDMGKGKAAAQCCHATLAAFRKIEVKDPKGLRCWEKYGQAKVTLKCPNEDEMLALQKKARSMGIVAESIRDAGRTQIAANSRTVLAVGPGPKKLIDEVCGHLKLY